MTETAQLPINTGASGHSVPTVHPLELFFDLVFVFAISQITHLVVEPSGLVPYGKAALLLVTVMWIYASFVMVSGKLGLHQGELQRWSVLGGMAVFFGISLGIPALAHGHPTTFAVFLVLASAVHLVPLSKRFGHGGALRRAALLRCGMTVLFAAVAVTGSTLGWVLWGVLAGVLLASIGRLGAFRVDGVHLCERLGLAVIITLGEGVVQAGTAVQDSLSVPHVLGAFVVVLLLASLWWIYFGLNADGFEHALRHGGAAVGPERFAMGHLAVIGGIILVSAAAPGLLEALGHRPYAAAVANLSVGVCLFLLGIVLLRYLVGQVFQTGLCLAALVAPVVISVASLVAGAAGLGVAVVLCLVVGFGYNPGGVRAVAARLSA